MAFEYIQALISSQTKAKCLSLISPRMPVLNKPREHVVVCSRNAVNHAVANRKWQDYVYIQCEYKSTKQKIKHLWREENKVKENKIS